MRVASLFTTVLLGAALILAGCASKDRKVSEYKPDRPLPLAASANKPAKYELYAVNTDNPLFYISLDRRAQFGFRNNGGRIVAFAQRSNTSSGKPVLEDIEIPLPGGDRVGYYWLKVADKK